MSFSSFKPVIEEGDTVILYLGLAQLYAIEVKPTIKNKHGVTVEYTFQTKYGALRVMDLVGKKYGSKVQLTKGYANVLYPTPELWTLTLPHRTQILYTPDISLIIMELDIRPGSVVCEAGTGSGSLSHAILRTIGPKGHLYTCDFHQERVEVAREEFKRHGHGMRVTVEARDVCENGWGKRDVANAVFLDLPEPWKALEHAVDSMHPNGGRVCSFSPCVEQVSRTCEVMRNIGLTEINTVECLQREFQFRCINIKPVEFKKVDKPQLQRTQDKSLESLPKKQKLNEEDSKKCVVGEAEDADSKEPTEPKFSRIKTAIPLLKMQGHTGFLTFASVPPRLKRRRSTMNKVADTSADSTDCAGSSSKACDYECEKSSFSHSSLGEIK